MKKSPALVQEPEKIDIETKLYKRPFDLSILIAAHLFLAPLWALLWVAIPLAIWLQDRGPIFYCQKRVGKNGRIFTVRKFRTMIPDAERYTGAMWSTIDDPRITRVGRILRWTALDELPQLLNIWKGEMSLVGPRAERPELHEKFVQEIPGFESRLQARPGLTGLAQVMGSYDLPPAEKLRYDLEYIQMMSLWLDLKLVILSVRNTLLAKWDRPESKPAAEDLSAEHHPSENPPEKTGIRGELDNR
jgi:lipopolysaccharide/colanic/teichoic acid biosynthesis glycosyltransferase